MAYKISTVTVSSAVCAVLLVAASWWYLHATSSAAGLTPQTAIQMTPTPVACSSPAATFCRTQVEMIAYVDQGDFSDILQQQTPAVFMCGKPSPAAADCTGIASGLTIDTYAVVQSGSTSYLTRNNYINFFRGYDTSYGPLRFKGDILSHGAMTMQFTGSSSAHGYSLAFSYDGGDWKLASAAVGAL